MARIPLAVLSLALAANEGAKAAPALAKLAVTSTAFAAGAAIPPRYSAYGANRSPPLRWSAVPGARAYAVILEDPDAPTPRPWNHWLIWNIPARVTALPEGLPTTPAPASVPGAVQGTSDAGGTGYFGPRPPSGVHHYHFRVIALDSPLTLAAGAGRAALSRAMSGHVLAAGELVATYAAPAR